MAAVRDSTMTLSEIQTQGAGDQLLQEPEDVLSMIPEIKAHMKSTKELDQIREIKRLKKAIEDKRKVERSSIRDELEELKRQLSLISANSQRGIQDWRTQAEHLAEMERLNTEKFALAKANAELQQAIEKLESNKVEEEERIEQIEAENPLEETDTDANALSLKIMREIGFQPIYDKSKLTTLTNAPPFDEMTVRSKARDTATLVNVSDEWMKQQDINAIAMADQLWKNVS